MKLICFLFFWSDIEIDGINRLMHYNGRGPLKDFTLSKPQLGNNNWVSRGRRSRRQNSFFNLLAGCQRSISAKGPPSAPRPSSRRGPRHFHVSACAPSVRNPTLTDDPVAPGVTPGPESEWRCHSACSWKPARGQQASAAGIRISSHLALLSRAVNKIHVVLLSGRSREAQHVFWSPLLKTPALRLASFQQSRHSFIHDCGDPRYCGLTGVARGVLRPREH